MIDKVETEEVPKVKRPLGNKNIANNKHWTMKEGDKQLIVALWAGGLTPSEVQERALEEFNITVSKSQIFKYGRAQKWQALIKKIKTETMNDVASVAGSFKKVRLSRAERIYEKAMSSSKPKLKEALAATEHQRKEMEGSGDFNITMNQFNVLSDDELEFKKKEVMQRIAQLNKGVITVEQPANQAGTVGS